MTRFAPVRDPEGIELKNHQEFPVRQGSNILDIGCGDGRLSWFYGQGKNKVIGSDVKLDELGKAQLARPKTAEGKVFFTAAEGQALPFPGETFDLAIFSWSL
jgi:ubiquinone/menaquinone biosynthesis C-methylase UbiE